MPLSLISKSLDYKNSLQLDVVDGYLRRMGDKTIRDEAPPSLESFYPPMSRRYRSTTIKVLWILCLVHQKTQIKMYVQVKTQEHRCVDMHINTDLL